MRGSRNSLSSDGNILPDGRYYVLGIAQLHATQLIYRPDKVLLIYRPNKVLCLADDLARSANDSTSAACQGFGI
jgi:hypothetical protein